MAETLKAPFVLASDLHIQHMADKRARLLLDVLGRLGPAVEYLVLNGDVFDFCYGDSDYYRRKFRPLGTALEAIAARGTRVLFVEGNHEFHMAKVGWQGVEFVTQRDYVVTLGSGERIKLTHGDLITDDPWYRAFRGIVKSQTARRAANLIPGGWLDAYSLRHAKVSRAHDKYRSLDHQRILKAFDKWLADGRYDFGVIGHFHVPYAETRPAGQGMMLSVDSWERPNLLIFEDGNFQRIYLEEPERPFTRAPLTSIFAQ
jgi:UDP-2,3-diacylglucosamine hydrolase